jgi:hypothetical protein
VALAFLASQIQELVDSEAGNGRLKNERRLLASGLRDAQAIVAALADDLRSAAPGVADGNPANVYKVGLNTSRLLMVLGDLVCSWLLLRQADVALGRLAAPLDAPDQAFYEGKVAAAQFFARTVLPRLAAERAVVESTDLAVMELDETAF